jgi:PPP family 3-phenylpropionic acid transporter
MLIIQTGLCLSGLVWALLYFEIKALWFIAIVLGLFSFFWNAVLPQFEVVTLLFLDTKTHLYSRIRLWGSLGFVGSAIGLGYILQETSTMLLLPIMLGIILLGGLTSFFIPKPPTSLYQQSSVDSIKNTLKRPEVTAFLLVSTLAHLSHCPYYTFYSLYLTEYGYSKSLVGWLWSLGVFSEIILFLFSQRLLKKYNWKHLVYLSLGLGMLRWQLIAWGIKDIGVLLVAQILHAASFGLFHLLAIEFIHQHFKGRSKSRGQALYGGVGFGLGGALGSWWSGLSWEHFGAIPTFTMASAALLLGISFCYGQKKLDLPTHPL